jgi:abequosyltransferase
MKIILLSICIATYNRGSYIGETLESIIPQLDDEVELLIVDGASTDNTQDVIKKYAQIESRLRYIRLPFKGGVDLDYDKSVQSARGKFCWLFTDDDRLKPGAVSAVKKAIKEGHGLIIVNAEVRNRDLTEVLQSRRIGFRNNKQYAPSSMEQLFVDVLHYLSFIGAVVVRRSVWMNRDRQSYFGTEFVHVGVIFQRPLPRSALVIAEPYIIIRLGQGQWVPRSFDIWMFKWPKLVWSFSDVSNAAKRRITPREPWRKFKVLFLQRSLGNYDLRTYDQYFVSMRVSVLWKFVAWLIAYGPRGIFVKVYCIYSNIKGGKVLSHFHNQFSKTER